MKKISHRVVNHLLKFHKLRIFVLEKKNVHGTKQACVFFYIIFFRWIELCKERGTGWNEDSNKIFSSANNQIISTRTKKM